ncbi:hemerythrin domain-containing protein [Streptomyces sp. WAC 00631]|uniref:hemerythrin domain-containing protein n=1 Tax=Streptomyces sp. WAC 00631 TaxID=2203201 RepID=UPI000F7A77CE|nr:hemerythrin domain-containing protein [Streptomyces sp. WAC 00631]MCC5033640.1 hemerythrin domain-containing protein [Streptomyces sp. WAC 00631]
MSQTTPAGIPDAPDAEKDVVALLMQQHGEIRNLFDEVERSEGDARRDAFHRLVRMLAVHETAEEEIVHPFVKRSVPGGEGVVAERLEEEREAKEQLARLEDMDTGDPGFLPALLALRMDVMRHARAEERYEFARLRRLNDPAKLASMARALRMAEATAPTHPHPGVESAARNMALGPLAAIVDRTRDTLRDVMAKDDGRSG